VLGLLVSMLVLLVLSGAFLIKPLLAEEPPLAEETAGGPEAGRVASLSQEERRQAIDELLWRLDHDLATGRIDADEHRRLKERAEQAQRAGRGKRAP
jgi:hypothetical protein